VGGERSLAGLAFSTPKRRSPQKNVALRRLVCVSSDYRAAVPRGSSTAQSETFLADGLLPDVADECPNALLKRVRSGAFAICCTSGVGQVQ
jgi:hypothetical protein